MPEPVDEQLVAQAREGSARAFRLLTERYKKPLYNYLRHMLGAAEDAEDVFQETFVRVYTHLHRFREGGRFRPWVYRIATNLARDRLRYRRRHPLVSLDRPADGSDGGATSLDRTAAPGANPREQAQASEMSERLAAAVAQLPEKHRAVFLMARYRGLPYQEIAQSLQIPVGTVKSRMNKAVESLLNALGEAAL